MPKSRLVGRVFGELAVIVVGVLLALQVETIREDREARSREQAQLIALRADFSENRSRLRSLIESQDRVLFAQRTLLEVSEGVAEGPSHDSLAYLVNRAAQFYRLEPVTGAYDALVASGDLRLIENADLRSALAAFVSDARTGHEDQELSTLMRTEMFRELAASTSFLAVLQPSWVRMTGFPSDPSEAELTALLSNRAYLSHLTVLGSIESIVRNYFVRLESDTEHILQLIDESLDE